MEPNNPYLESANPEDGGGQRPAQHATPENRPAAQTRSGNAPGPSTVVVRSSVVPVILLLVLCVTLGLGLLLSLAFNVYSAAAYAQYFQTDAQLTESHHSGEQFAKSKIAIISVEGVMLEGNGFTKRQIDRVREDKNVKAVVLRVDSPGGAVTAADYLYHHLKQLREERDIPIVVSMGSMAASGGYYVAMAASPEEKVIYCEPTGITGSIGVIIPRYDVSDLLAKYDIKSDSIVSHEHKEMGSWTKELKPEERRRLQAQVDLLFGRFKDIIKEGRPQLAQDEDALDQVATGEVFTGIQAKKLMLIDEVGFIEDAIERAAELARLGTESYRVIQFKSPPSLADALVGSVEAQQSPLSTRDLLEMTTPRAYYLYSTLPGFVAR